MVRASYYSLNNCRLISQQLSVKVFSAQQTKKGKTCTVVLWAFRLNIRWSEGVAHTTAQFCLSSKWALNWQMVSLKKIQSTTGSLLSWFICSGWATLVKVIFLSRLKNICPRCLRAGKSVCKGFRISASCFFFFLVSSSVLYLPAYLQCCFIHLDFFWCESSSFVEHTVKRKTSWVYVHFFQHV